MEKEDRAVLQHMSESLDNILAILSKPPNILVKAFETGAAGVTLLGIISVIDVIKNWIGG